MALQSPPSPGKPEFGTGGSGGSGGSGVKGHSILHGKPVGNPPDYRLGIVGRYVFDQAFFEAAATTRPDARGELTITDTIATLVREGHGCFAVVTEGPVYDAGTPAGVGSVRALHLDDPNEELPLFVSLDRRPAHEHEFPSSKALLDYSTHRLLWCWYRRDRDARRNQGPGTQDGD